LEGRTSIDVIIPWTSSKAGMFYITLEQFHHNTSMNISPEIQSSINIQDVLPSPLQQIKNGVALFNVVCSDDKIPAYKYDNTNVVCVTEETHVKLVDRVWALLRFTMPGENPSQVLCNRYEGKWHPEYDGCRGITDLQCSLMDGTFVDGLKICYNEICPVDKTYIICVTNIDLLSRGIENES